MPSLEEMQNIMDVGFWCREITCQDCPMGNLDETGICISDIGDNLGLALCMTMPLDIWDSIKNEKGFWID